MRTAFLGLGLVGGSIARALREASGTGTEWHLTAWTPGGSGPRVAREAGVLDAVAATPGEAVEGADLIVLAAPPIACQGLLRDLAGSLRGSQGPDTVITDVASTKGAIVDLAGTLALRFVGGHPMAGRETSGFGAADAKLFQGRPWVLVPSSDVAAVGRVEAVVGACGARVVRMGAADHDAAVAAISHLPLVLSAALVEAVAGRPDRPRVDWAQAAQLAAGGWEGMTRLARGDVDMGTGIATTNAPAIARRLRDLRAVIDEWLADLERPDGPDRAGVRDRLTAARSMLER